MAKTIYTKQRTFLSKKLIEAREIAGLSQQYVEKKGVISQSELSKVETGQRRIDFLVLLKLAELYSQPIKFFIPPKEI